MNTIVSSIKLAFLKVRSVYANPGLCTAADFVWEGLSYTDVFVTVNSNYTSYLKTPHKSFMHKINPFFDIFLKFSLGTIDCTLNFPSDCSGRNTSWRKFRFLQLGCRRFNCYGVS